MQINVSSVHLLIPTINHYRLAHQFLAIIRSYRQGCNIILKYLVTTIHRTTSRHRTLSDTAPVGIWGEKWGREVNKMSLCAMST